MFSFDCLIKERSKPLQH